MKSLTSFIAESKDNALLFENINFNADMTLENVYEALFDTMFADGQINEGFFGKLGAWLKKGGEKAADFGDVADKKIEQAKQNLSDAAKNAIETAKQKAGDAWDTVKDTYTNAVAAVDSAVQNAKGAIADAAKAINVKAGEIEATVAEVYTNALAKGGKIADTIKAAVADAPKNTAITQFLIAAIVAKKSGLNSSQLLDIMTAAGIN